MNNFVVISSDPRPGKGPDHVMSWFYDLEEAKTYVKNIAEETADNYFIAEVRSSYERKWVGL